MNQEIKKLIVDILNKLNYDTTDEELYKYLYEKGIKAINKIEKENYSLEKIKSLLIQNIPIMMKEYNRLSTTIKNKSNQETKFGVSINYQLIELIELAKLSSSSTDFLNMKNDYLKKQTKIFPGLKECTYEEILNINNNIINNCDVITPEIEAKMSLTVKENKPLLDKTGQINNEIFDFTYLDKIVKFANDNEMQIRFHTLLWHQHFPKLLKSCTKEQCLKFLDSYFSAIANKYDETIFSSIDVINEMCADINSNEFKAGKILRDSPWKQILGESYYIDVLKLARKHFPNSNLVYNEYDETNSKKRKNMISLIKAIKLEEDKLGVTLLDSIGLQSHYNEFTSDEEIKQTYNDLSKLGKKLQISEFDITEINSQNDVQVNRVTRTVLDCAATANVDYLTCWGPSSKISWKSNKVKTLLDDSGNMDKSFQKLANTYSMKYKTKYNQIQNCNSKNR